MPIVNREMLFSAAEVLRIRAEWDSGAIRVRAWADAKGCSPETIRKIGRRDTYRQVRVPEQLMTRRRQHVPDGMDELPQGRSGVDEPGEQEMNQSLARLQVELDKAPLTSRGVDSILGELARKGADDAQS